MKRPSALAGVAALCLAATGISGGCASDLAGRRVSSPTTAASIAGTSDRDAQTATELASAALTTAASLDVLENVADAAARRQAAARLIDLYAPALLAAPRQTVVVPVESGGRFLRLRLRQGAGPGGVAPTRFVRLKPTDDLTPTRLAPVTRTPGVGVPLVATLRPMMPVNVPGPVPTQPVAGIVWAVTAVPVLGAPPSAGGRRVRTLTFDLYDPHGIGRITGPGGCSHPLAADYSTPLAAMHRHFGPQRRGLRGFLSGSGDFSSTGLYPSQQPTLDKTPLVFVHGLISDPTDFYPLHNALEHDPEVRRRYQVWFFYYPTSLSVVYSAMLLREDLEAFVHQLDPRGTHPALHRVVLVGHSMGGVLCRLAISDGGDAYYRHFFRRPVDELTLSSSDRQLVRRGFFYHASPDVAQVVFVATPHRGNKLAGGLLGNLGRLMVRVPLAVRTRVNEIVFRNRTALAAGAPLKPGSSLDSLSPRDPLVAAVNDLPMRPGVRVHSILGDRGRGGPPERSSDGVVSYASSHLPQAESERLVPAGHVGTLKRPETAEEVLRILHQ